jgi:hypothetical protein
MLLFLIWQKIKIIGLGLPFQCRMIVPEALPGCRLQENFEKYNYLL